MKKIVFKTGKMAAAGLALALAVGTAGCSGGSETGNSSAKEAAMDAQEDGADSENGVSDSQENSVSTENGESQEAQLPEYTPVDPASVAESAEEDFIFEDQGDGLIYITGYQGAGGQVKIPAHLGGAERIIIKSDAFKTNETITYIYIPETVTRIEEYSFRDCPALEEAYVAGQALTIEKSTFRGCTALRRVELAEGVTGIEGSMDSGAFQDCTSLTEVVFPNSLNNRIEINAFYGCTALETVDLSNTQLLGIGQMAFGYCENLKTVKLPATLQWVESNSFLGTPALAEFTVGEGNAVLEVEDGIVYTLDFCGPESPNTALLGLEGAAGEDVAIREGTEKIASHAFSHNYTIKTLKLPDNVKYTSGTTQDYVFSGNEDVIFTYLGQEYTYDQAAQLDSFLVK